MIFSGERYILRHADDLDEKLDQLYGKLWQIMSRTKCDRDKPI